MISESRHSIVFCFRRGSRKLKAYVRLGWFSKSILKRTRGRGLNSDDLEHTYFQDDAFLCWKFGGVINLGERLQVKLRLGLRSKLVLNQEEKSYKMA